MDLRYAAAYHPLPILPALLHSTFSNLPVPALFCIGSTPFPLAPPHNILLLYPHDLAFYHTPLLCIHLSPSPLKAPPCSRTLLGSSEAPSGASEALQTLSKTISVASDTLQTSLVRKQSQVVARVAVVMKGRYVATQSLSNSKSSLNETDAAQGALVHIMLLRLLKPAQSPTCFHHTEMPYPVVTVLNPPLNWM